jgi:hypothetical protein
MSVTAQPNVRLATIDELSKTTIPSFLFPVPSRDTLRDWFDRARIPRFKANPAAKRGGGPVFYQVASVEKFLRQRTMVKIKVQNIYALPDARQGAA